MGSMSFVHWIIVLAVVLLLFGRGKVSELMGDVAKGIKSFKKGMAEDDADPTRTIDHGRDTIIVDRPVDKNSTIG